MIATLDSGLTVAVERMPGVASVSFDILLPVGSAHDPEGRCGLASLLLEILLRGAGDRDARALTEAQDAIGLERDADFNDETMALSGSLLGRDLPKALAIYRDVLAAPRLDADELAPSIDLCIQQIRAIDDHPSEKLFVELARLYFPQPWGRPGKGLIEEIERITIPELRAAADAFTPRGTIIAIAGDVDEAEGIRLVEETFGSWRGGGGPPTLEARPPESGPDHIEKEAGAQVQIGMFWPGLPATHPDYPKAQLLVSLLSGGMSGRLFVEVREKRGLVYSVRASYAIRRDRGDYWLYAGTTRERAAETLAVIEGELERIRAGVERAEFEKAKTQLKSSIVMSQESTRARAGSMAGDWFRLGKVRTRDEILAAYDAVTFDDLNAFLAGVSYDGRRTLTLGPRWKAAAP
jgi:predicted Zn-dependent peptidase